MQEVENIYGASVPAAGRSTTTEMMVSRQAQEVQAAMVVAKKFPRNEVESYNRIIRACQFLLTRPSWGATLIAL